MDETPKIYTAIANIMADVKAIPKSQRNETQKFQYRGIDDIMNDLHDIFAKNKVFILPNVLETTEERIPQDEKNRSLRFVRTKMSYTFVADDGSDLEIIMEGEAMDYGDKALSKSYSVALKYALIQMLLIPTSDDKDPDAHSPLQPNNTGEADGGNRRTQTPRQQPKGNNQQPSNAKAPQIPNESKPPKEKAKATPEKLEEWLEAIGSGKSKFDTVEKVKELYIITSKQENMLTEALKQAKIKAEKVKDKIPVNWGSTETQEAQRAIQVGINKGELKTLEMINETYLLDKEASRIIRQLLKLTEKVNENGKNEKQGNAKGSDKGTGK